MTSPPLDAVEIHLVPAERVADGPILFRLNATHWTAGRVHDVTATRQQWAAAGVHGGEVRYFAGEVDVELRRLVARVIAHGGQPVLSNVERLFSDLIDLAIIRRPTWQQTDSPISVYVSCDLGTWHVRSPLLRAALPVTTRYVGLELSPRDRALVLPDPLFLTVYPESALWERAELLVEQITQACRDADDVSVVAGRGVLAAFTEEWSLLPNYERH